MAYTINDQLIGQQKIAETSTTARHPLGTIVTANDPDYGAGEFIYLKGVASTVVGSWVTYSDLFATTLIVANAIGDVAVAMSANVADQYGWYQIGGKAVARADDVADSGLVYIDTATGGVCDDVEITGDRVHRAKWASADDTSSGTGYADVLIARPFVDDGEASGAT